MNSERHYISILRDSLEKKERILNNLYNMTQQQADYLNNTEFEPDVFNEMMDVKAQMIDELDTVDSGFESMYGSVREYLKAHSKDCATEILELQNRIREIMRLSMNLQALEERNRVKLEKIFSSKSSEIKHFRQNNEKVSQYYHTMTGAGVNNFSILDKKN